ncbi:MAG: TetR/AcrR family transcriptional regulator [Acidimicrobiia bacterium]
MARITGETKQATRASLLEAAADEFAREGRDGANVNRISRAAGFAQGTVYNYFTSKDALFFAVVEEACQRAATGADSVSATASTRERLLAAVAADVDWARNNEAFARVLVREALAADIDVYVRIVQAAAPFMDKVVIILVEGVQRGEIDDDVAVEQLTLTLVGLTLLMLAQHWRAGGGWPTLDEIPGYVVALVLDGVGRDEEQR